MANFTIYGAIVDTDVEKESFEDTTPSQLKAFLKKLDANEDVVVSINSPGGSVTAGIAIANMLKNCGHKTIAKVDGLAASIASVIMCACDEIQMTSTSLIMVHNPWGQIIGNANDLRREADVMDKMREAMMSFYMSKFIITSDGMKELMDNETWFTGSEAHDFGLKCEVIEDSRFSEGHAEEV